MTDRHGSRRTILCLLFFLVTVAARIPFCSRYLYHMDSVNFALALEDYNVTLHQPHPPGYFFYVMLGRLVHLIVHDANHALLVISVVFSGLTVATVYLLAEEMYDRRTGITAACFALTSPNLWFHGEIALSYGVEAFFSALTGLLCWKAFTGRGSYLFAAASCLAVAGGIRQNTVVFLLPLLLFAAGRTQPRRVVAALLLLGGLSLSWFAPMLWMTGGWKSYAGAFNELWEFSTGHNSVFNRGMEAFALYGQTLYNFTVYSAGAGLLAVGIAAYVAVRHGTIRPAVGPRLFFFAVWTFPAILFYLLIFIHPRNPGYALIFTPPLLLVCARATICLAEELKKLTRKEALPAVASALFLINTGAFLFSVSPVSWREIKSHDETVAALVHELSSYDPSTTAIFAKPYVFYGFRHLMYYLPQYRVYAADGTTSPAGRKRMVFWGTGGKTLLSQEICLDTQTRCIATILEKGDYRLVGGKNGIVSRPVTPELAVASGAIAPMAQVFPALPVSLSGVQR